MNYPPLVSQFAHNRWGSGTLILKVGVDNALGFVSPTHENSRKQTTPGYKALRTRMDRFLAQFPGPQRNLPELHSLCTMGAKYLNLTPPSGHTFTPKCVYMPAGGRIVLGRATESNPTHPSNGLFPREMSISLNHAEVWYEDGRVG